ncbi:MAG: peptidase M48 [Rhodovulum sulfidophilum]|uniref:Peptidase M48 n=1 Tax=Rhodovulum sulfidophilum TaxID=35806 RepID=A0A2W5N0Q8_RHOSU|nr:MAG: peptidase M48 [Rhodovulum sulfidophilum]
MSRLPVSRARPSRALAAALLLALAGCGATYQVPADPGSSAIPPAPGGAAAGPSGAARGASDFRRVAARVEPVAESFCREEHPGAAPIACDFAIGIARDPDMPPNAFQTRDENGRPLIVMSAALLGQMTDDDEIAFVLSHEASHQIADHLSKQQRQQTFGALVFGGLAAAAGQYGGAPASDAQIRQAMDMGAFFGGRAYSQTYELEADTLGAFIAARAGYDPARGARIFQSPALAGGGGLLATHPASEARMRVIDAAAAEIRRQEALGLDPRPGYAAGRF